MSFENDKRKSSRQRFAAGRIGRAASFDGTSFLDAGHVANFEIEDRFTLAAWIYSAGAPDGSVMSRMIDQPKGKGFGVHCDHGRVHVNITSNWTDDAIRMETEQVLPPDEWHHVAVTFSGSRMAEGIHVYVDGRPAKTRVLLDSLYGRFATPEASSTSRFASAPVGDRSGAFAA